MLWRNIRGDFVKQKIFTLCVVYQRWRILLGMKKVGCAGDDGMDLEEACSQSIEKECDT